MEEYKRHFSILCDRIVALPDKSQPDKSQAEQRKIAECLQSLDELIAAETEKLEALKRHKKGLLQHLFPAEGETIPRLRFSEFCSSGEWDEHLLRETCARIMDGTHFSPKSTSGPFMYLTSRNIQDGEIQLETVCRISQQEHEAIYRRCPVKVDDVLLTKDGANTGNCALNTIDEEFSLLSSVAVLRGRVCVLQQHFLYHSLMSDTMQATLRGSMAGQAITRITLEKLGSFRLRIPSFEEQNRVASVLDAADAALKASGKALRLLRIHKTALMQQLFPALDEVEG
jgi:type I restriction enzyme S subunit